MNGLALARASFEETGQPLLARRFPGLAGRVAAGLVGEGSECFGFDDAVSHDHDWEPAFCLWLTAGDLAAAGDSLASALAEARGPASSSPDLSLAARGRRGVLGTETFYLGLTGLGRAPRTLAEWAAVPETGLAAATNGEVFADPLGAFSAVRSALLAFFPEDVRLAKLASRCAAAAQSGQYNLPRCLARGERLAALSALGLFVEAALAAAFLLERRHRPFYKWAPRALGTLPRLGPELGPVLARLAADGPGGCLLVAAPPLVEEASTILVRALRRDSLSDASGDFLLDHARALAARVEDPGLAERARAAAGLARGA